MKGRIVRNFYRFSVVVLPLLLAGCGSVVLMEAELIPPNGGRPELCLQNYKRDFMMMADEAERAEARRKMGECVRRYEAQGYKAKLPWD